MQVGKPLNARETVGTLIPTVAHRSHLGNVSWMERIADVTSSSVLLFAVVCLGMPGTDDGVNKKQTAGSAEELFKLYVARSNAFDERLADLYADEAKIRILRGNPNGQAQKISFTGKEWKKMLRRVMPLAKKRGDTDKFSDVTYKNTEDGVCIKATRYSDLKKYSSPISWLVRENKDGEWLIYAENSESRP